MGSLSVKVLLIFLVKNALLFITSSIVCQHFQSTEIKWFSNNPTQTPTVGGSSKDIAGI